jgi:hypothetical protein
LFIDISITTSFIAPDDRQKRKPDVASEFLLRNLSKIPARAEEERIS